MIVTKKKRRLRRAVKARAHIRDLGVARLSVHRTPNHIYAQVTDPLGARVIAGGRDVRRWARDRARKLAAQRRQRETEKPTGGS